MRQQYREIAIPVTTVGSAGAATGTADSEIINGEIVSMRVDYSGAPATTTVDVDEVGGDGRKLLDKAASNTDVTHNPRVQMQDNTGTAIAGIYERFTMAGRKVRVTVALSDALAPAVTVTLIVKEGD